MASALDELVVLEDFRDLCFGNSVTVREVLEEMCELSLRHCVISIPQSESEIGARAAVLNFNADEPEEVYKRFKIFDMKDVLVVLNSLLLKGDHRDLAECKTEVLEKLAYQVCNVSGRNNYKPVWWPLTSVRTVLMAFQDCSRIPIFQRHSDTNSVEFISLFSATDFFKMLCHYFTKRRVAASRDANGESTSESAGEGVSEGSGVSENSDRLIENLLNKIRSDTLENNDWFERSAHRRIVSVQEHQTMAEVVAVFAETGFSGLPIIISDGGDEESPLRPALGLISSSDLRFLMLHDVGCQLSGITVISYLSLVKRSECLKTRYPIISVKKDATILQIVHKLIKTEIHRIFVVEDGNLLIGVFSRTDFGKLLAHECQTLVSP